MNKEMNKTSIKQVLFKFMMQANSWHKQTAQNLRKITFWRINSHN